MPSANLLMPSSIHYDLAVFQNFLALCASDFYNDCLFHRNIKGFMVQTGDPTGTGKGGTSIWKRKFDDEITDNIKVGAFEYDYL